MKAVVYTGDNSAEYTDVDSPVLQDGQTRVDLSFCGICGSDMHAWHGHDERRVPPLVLGHEAVGRAKDCLLYTSPSPRDVSRSRMPSSA